MELPQAPGREKAWSEIVPPPQKEQLTDEELRPLMDRVKEFADGVAGLSSVVLAVENDARQFLFVTVSPEWDWKLADDLADLYRDLLEMNDMAPECFPVPGKVNEEYFLDHVMSRIDYD